VIYGTRLRQAREFCKLTQRAIDDEIGLNQGRLSEAERDTYALSAEVLTQFAALTGFPVEFFLEPVRVTFDVMPLHFRSRAAMRAKDARQAECAGEIIVEAALDMLDQLEGPQLQISALTDALSPKDAAALARDLLCLTWNEPIQGLPILLEHAGVLTVALPLAAERRDAFSLWHDDAAVVALLDTDAGDRQCWSVAHELGHLLMHKGVGASKSLESEADEFAMHFLTPLKVMEREIPVNATLHQFALLKRRWGVSIAALIRTARRIDKIDDYRYTSLFRQMSARGERLRERAAIAPIKPRGFRAMSEVLYGPAPAEGLARAARWTAAFAEQVLDRHATNTELPLRRPNNVVNLASRRAHRQSS
jgi:Zn-dependent peptidase ImmA (M78 family)/transcriptional regulator with XRE-family HTH domain